WFPDDLKRKINAVNQPLIDLPSSEAGFPVIYTHKSLLPQDMQSIQFEMAFDNIDTVHGYNVVGRLEGNIREYVVIGAHYDHLGVVKNSGNGDYYAGADDNASGVAGLLEICRRWAGRDRNGRGLIAVSFTAEEDGMLGSRWFVDHLPVPRESIVAMINMDEIGRRGFASMRDVHRQDAPADAKYTVAYYSGASLQLEELIESAARGIDLNVSANPVNSFSHFGDAGAFHEAQIPTVNIFSGFHSDYHKPSDTPDKLDYVKMAEIIKFVDALLIELSMSHERIRFDPRIKVEKPVIPH
ncbi:MAG: M20/M25/M40 family metallo-hydrolase, partial [Calditrichaeota bacterium]|nr:M20/M25/M40 family metallo-hydrolase [Calditrichota bacterium]